MKTALMWSAVATIALGVGIALYLVGPQPDKFARMDAAVARDVAAEMLQDQMQREEDAAGLEGLALRQAGKYEWRGAYPNDPPRVVVAGDWYRWGDELCHLNTRRDPDDGQWVRDCPALYPLEILADSVVVMVDNVLHGGTPCPTGAILTISRADWDAMPENMALRDPDIAGVVR